LIGNFYEKKVRGQFSPIKWGLFNRKLQHYEPIDFFGGEESLLKTKERDLQKINKCKENDCTIIVVNEGYVFEDVNNTIHNIIKENVIKHRHIIIQ
jgi:hypothetical protein